MASVVINYAAALFQLSINTDSIREAEEIFEENTVLIKALESPVVPFKNKCNVIDKIFPKDMRSFIKVVCKKGRISLINDIFDEYKRIYNREKGIVNADIYYVAKPTDKQQEKLKSFLKKRLGVETVNLNLVHKPELMGGFVINANGIEYDRSFKGRIDALNRKLVRR